MDCPLKPLYDNVIVAQDAPDEQTAAGIVLANDAKKPKNTGTILAVGEGRLMQHCNVTYVGGRDFPPSAQRMPVEPLRVKVGDRVMFSTYAGNEVEYPVPGPDGKPSKQRVLIMGEDEIIAVLPPPAQ